MRQLLMLLFSICWINDCAQDFGAFPKISKEKLLRDLDLLYQGLDKYHTGMYWYTPKDSVDLVFEQTKKKINRDLNVLEFHKLVGPLVELSREDHTDIYLPSIVEEQIKNQATFLPLIVVFLGEKLYCVKNGSNQNLKIEGKEIQTINGEKPKKIIEKIGSLFASDGFIKAVKYSDLKGFGFSKYYYFFYGNLPSFEAKIDNQLIKFEGLKIDEINQHLINRYQTEKQSTDEEDECLEFRVINDTLAYIGLHSFSNSTIKENRENKDLNEFLKKAFESIVRKGIKNLIIDVSENGGGNEGNEGLVYSYLGDNYQKYIKVRAKTQKVILDNGVDKPIKLRTFGLLERVFSNKKISDGSYERKNGSGWGLMAYKKQPKHKFEGNLFVIISPITYSGGSELANMISTNDLATFVGQETGGGYYGNTSGYSKELTLPHSGITVDIPSLQFMMNVKEKMPIGRGVIPDYKVIPTIEQYLNGERASLSFIQDLINR